MPMRCRAPNVTREQLDAAVAHYEESLARLPTYTDALEWWIARYSRGDAMPELAGAFPRLVDKVAAADALERAKYQNDRPLLAHEGRYAVLFRDALVLASLALCLRAPADVTEKLLRSCERGDPLFEAVAGALPSTPAMPAGPPAFAQFFDGLYAALDATPADRPRHVAQYLAVWRSERMAEFGFIIAHEHIGYWCFEAAGAVVALDIDDRSFADHPHYPRDLVAFARGTKTP
jgi:hypothetical protein